MDENFAGFLEDFGQPTSKVEAPASVIERFRGKLPNQLLEYWKAFGFCSFQNGLFFIVNPDDYTPALAAWIGDTDAAKLDSFHVIGRTAFGNLYLWGKKTGHRYVVSVINGTIYEQSGDEKRIVERGEDYAMQLFFGVKDPKNCDVQDEENKPLFEHAVKKLGPLGPDEVFAFEPAIGAGGVADLKNIKKRNVHVYLSLLAQMCPRSVMDLKTLRSHLHG